MSGSETVAVSDAQADQGDASSPWVERDSHPLLVKPTSRPRRRWPRRLATTALSLTLLTLGTWVAIHRVPWLGPTLADGLRAVLGPAAVAWMEDVAYGVQDRVDRWRYADAEPKTFWELPPGLDTEVAAEPDESWDFQPATFTAPFPKVATPADGIWVPIPDERRPDAAPAAFKSLVHPDPERSFAALAVVAIDTKAFELHLVAGTMEPSSERLRRSERPGRIPKEHVAALFAAFNGGFKATHGQYGMSLGGIEYLPPRDIACTLARYRDGSLGIGTWSRIADKKSSMLYYRQTPPCLVEDGKLHEILQEYAYARKWGATVSGETIIRRSAVGLSEDGRTLMYGLGEAMTAQAIARGMQAAGAHWVAELDVNFSYPRFLFYERDAADVPVASSALIPSIDFTADEYVTRPSIRDFFYLTRREQRAALPSGSRPKLAAKR